MRLRKAHITLLFTGLCCFISVLPSVAQSNSINEEMRVRQLYKQINYLTQVNTVSEAASEAVSAGTQITSNALQSKINAGQVTFELGSFQEGSIADIRGDHWTDFVTPEFKLPQVLEVVPNINNRADMGADTVSWLVAKPKWHPVNLTSLDAAGALFSVTVGTIMDQGSKQFLTPDVAYSNYATYIVTVSFGGQTIGPYHAMVLFGKNAKGENVMSLQDQGVDGGATLGAAMPHAPVYPRGLVQTRLRNQAAVASWLTEHSASASSCTQADASQLCCSDDSCAIPVKQLRKDLEAPLAVAPSTH